MLCALLFCFALHRHADCAQDNTNPDAEIRAQWVALARKHGVPIRCIWFKTPLQLCEHNDAVRSLNKKVQLSTSNCVLLARPLTPVLQLNPEGRQVLPKLAFNGYASRFKEPKPQEGFEDVIPVHFKFRGSSEEHGIWARYWL